MIQHWDHVSVFILFFYASVVVGLGVTICNESQCITCHHCSHDHCLLRMKLTCYTFVKRGGNGNHGDSNCACQPEDYCDGFYSCHNWPCPDSGLIPRCNIRNHTCICLHRTETCSGSDVSTCKITCNSQEKLYCDHGFCSCKSLDYCNQNNTECANHSCNEDLRESPFCNVTRCQCAVVVDACQGSDTSTCRDLNCNGQFMHQICNNGVCQCQLNPSCSSAVNCTETNTAVQIDTIVLECKSQYGLYTDCKYGRCQCFQNTSSTTSLTTTFTVPTTTASTTRSTTPQKQTTITSTTPKQPTATRDIITQHQISSATTGPSTPAKVQTVTQPIPNASIDPNAAKCASRMDCNQQNTYATLLTFAMPCPLAHIDCVNNKCFYSIDKVTTTNRAASTTSTSALRVTTTAAPVVSTTYSLHTRLICPECDANLTCKWIQSCYPGEVCMLRQYHMDPFTVHCSKKQDCLFMKRNMIGTEILCCEDHQCITNIIP